jgi:hypothetical protein
VSQCLRKRYVDFPDNLPEFGDADTAVHNRIAVRTDCSKVPDVFVHRQVLRHVARRSFRGAASETVDFSWPACALILGSTVLKEGTDLASENQGWAFSINGGESVLDPCTDGILMNGKPSGDLFDRVVVMDLHTAVIGVAFSHEPLSAATGSRTRIIHGPPVPAWVLIVGLNPYCGT